MRDALLPIASSIFLGLTAVAAYEGQFWWAALFAPLAYLTIRAWRDHNDISDRARAWRNHDLPPRQD